MMVNVRGRARVEAGGATSPPRRQSPIEAGYQHCRLERQGALLADKTLLYYDGMVLPFLDWLEGQEVRGFQLWTRPTLWRTREPRNRCTTRTVLASTLCWPALTALPARVSQ